MTGGSTGMLARYGGRLLVLRADASTAGGTGNLMRMLALAQAWLDGGGRTRLLVADSPAGLLARIAGEGIAIESIPAPAGSAGDAAVVRAVLATEPGARAAVDGLQFEGDFFDALGETAARVLAVDDRADRATYPVGYVLNQNAHAERAAYPADARCRFLLGLRYVLLRREFAAAPPPRATPPVARNVLVTFGGADPTAMTARTLRAMRLLPAALRSTLRVRALVGAANTDGQAIAAAAADPALGIEVDVRKAVEDMPAQMAWADLAVTSGGSTVWELARAGCPALVVETVPIERLLVAGLVKVGLFGHLGPEAGLDERNLADEIAAKAEDVAWRSAMTERGMGLIDGAGARRVADALAGREDEERT